LLAMGVNDNACFLNERVALESIASKLAPTRITQDLWERACPRWRQTSQPFPRGNNPQPNAGCTRLRNAEICGTSSRRMYTRSGSVILMRSSMF
jgi:hypothetical protein